ncbi:MAG TPA: nuclear transport factor 2 family protein [Planctomycetota bacterium]
MRAPLIALLLTSACASAGGRHGGSLSPAERAELLGVRAAVWRAFFTGDEGTLLDLLPPDFIAIDPSGPIAPGREGQVEGLRAFRDSGGQLVALDFPVTEIQLLGDVAVLYTTYAVELATPQGPQRLAGRATEVFQRRDGRWVHPGWHLDTHQ